MATERQIAANRSNARSSTGPRSNAAKERSSRNAYRHGLRANLQTTGVTAKRLERLVRKVAGNSKKAVVLEHARTAAQAELDLARVRQTKVALIERVSALGSLDAPQALGSSAEEFLKSIVSGRVPPVLPERIDCLTDMPTTEPERTAEAIRRALPELVKLERYESRAAARRDKAIQQIIKSRVVKNHNP